MTIIQAPSSPFRECSLELPVRLSFKRWVETGEMLATMHARLPWWIGDWWLEGDRRYGERAAQADLNGINRETAMSYATVCKRVSVEERVPELSFTTHRVVAYLPARQRRRWLKRALKEGWGSTQLKAALDAQTLVQGAEEGAGPRGDAAPAPSISPREALVTIRKDPIWREVADSAISALDEVVEQVRCPSCGHTFSVGAE